MPLKHHTFINADQSLVRDEALIEGGKWRVRVRTCRGGRSEGVQVVELDNGAMCIDVLPTRGMGIWRVRRGDQTLGWQSPVREPVHPSFVQLMEPAGLGWLDGFNELMCRCGLESNAAPEFDDAGRLQRPLHGRIANTPAKFVELVVDEDAGLLTLKGIVDEARFHFQSLRLTTSLTTKIGSNEFSWSDEVTNIGGRDATLQMLYHFNIGQPLLQPGAKVTAPTLVVAPHSKVAANEGVETWNIMPPPRPGTSEQVFLTDLATDATSETRVLFGGLANEQAVSLRFNKRTLPCFSVWRNTPAVEDGYVIGLEPGTNYPNPRTFEGKNGRVVHLKSGETWKAAVAVSWHTDEQSIRREEEAIRAIQGERKAELQKNQHPEWSS